MTAPSTRPTNQDRIRAALWFAERGFGIFPVWSTTDAGMCRCPKGRDCTSPGKHPLTPDGFKAATMDATRISTFLSAASDPNYGMTCPDGVLALDVDGEDGPAHLDELEQRYGRLPATLRTRTANGLHIFLRWPDAHPRPLRQLFGFVTRWGTGSHAGYVIGPRSVHPSGVAYAPADDAVADIATLPDAWAIAGVRPASGKVTVSSGPRLDTVQAGGRHEFLRDRARTLRGGGLSGEALFDAVNQVNLEYCVPPKSADEVRQAIGDVETKFEPDPLPGTSAHELRGDDELGLLPPSLSGAFPAPPADEAFEGLLGECTYALADGTDASLAGLLGSLIAFCGALVPGQAYFHRLQTSSPFIALVGESSIGRKGTAMTRAFDAVADAIDRMHVNRVVIDGLNSGEGLVTTLHYKSMAFPYEPTVGLVFEEEYASLLASRSREGSTLDPKMRAAFDGSPLSNRKAGETKTVVPPYWLPALIAITPTELRSRLEAGALHSGSANRWLYLPVVRREVIPSNAAPVLPGELREALRTARKAALDSDGHEIGVEPAVVRTLSDYADFLPRSSFGLAGDLVRRFSIIAFRIALVHALVERAQSVSVEHLHRALALAEYARRGVAWVFGNTIGNRDADLLLRHLQATGTLRTRSISREIIRDPIRRQDAIDELARLGYAEVVKTYPGAGGGRPRSELRLQAAGGGFVTFVHGPDKRTPPNQPDLVTKPGFERETAGQNAARTVTKPGQNPAKTVTEPPAVAEVISRTGEWSKPCRDYPSHQDSHRNTSAGWVCDACDPPEARP